MQLGVRWRAGDPPHRGVPQVLLDAVRATEAAHPAGESWTLTWLEGRPRAELISADATVLAEVYLDAAGQVQAVNHDAQAPGTGAVDNADTDDDDDWLN
ncbi:Fe-S oxidoreductase [Leucobacter denitrificans]|uniref:Fe-S oxidoreductase n=1 Tax=Leucobacter denitrificans TaxID=683042 RepID=UPI001FECDA2F|nr:Fe-S oxidoreductase [Leucobacter denitrificans]